MNKPVDSSYPNPAALQAAGIYTWAFSVPADSLESERQPRLTVEGGWRSWFRKLRPRDRRALWNSFHALRLQGTQFELLVAANQDSSRPMYLRITGSGSETGELFGVVSDVTSTVEVQIKESDWVGNPDLGFRLERSSLALVQWDENHRIIRWSRRAEEIFGWSEAEVRGLRFDDFKFIYEGDRAKVEEVIGTLVNEQTDSCNCYNRNYDKAGRLRYCIWHNTIRRDADGKLHSILSLADEVSSEISAALNRHDASEQLQATLENLSEAFISINKEEYVVHTNKRMVEMLQLPREQIEGRRINEIFSEEDNPIGFTACRRAM
jgi:PAS domain S-box-containing protein